MDDVTKGAGPYAPLPPPPTAGGQIACVYQAEPDQATAAITSSAWLIGNAAGGRPQSSTGDLQYGITDAIL